MPDTWTTVALEDIVVPKGLVRGPFGGALKKSFFTSTGHKVYEQKNAIYRSTHLGSYYINDAKFNELIRFSVKADDFIVSCSGTIGKIFRIPHDAPSGVINQALLKITLDESKVLPSYFNYYFNWPRFQAKIIDSTQGGAMQNLVGMEIFRKTELTLPPLDLQKKIASVLEVWDEYLEKLDKKIELKKNIKNGLMQNLLTGKNRLAGFSGEWQTKKLGDILNKLTDYTANGSFAGLKENVTYYSHSEYSVLVRTTDLEKPVFVPQRFTDKQGHDYLKKTSLYGGELIMANVGNIGKVYRVPVYDKPMTLAPNTYLIEFSDKLIDQEFIYQIMLMQSFKNKVLKMVGSGGLVAINKANFRSIEILIPSDKDEQTAIAEVLTTADNELKALKRKRDSVATQRKHLLNNLISGKIRTPENLKTPAKEVQYA